MKLPGYWVAVTDGSVTITQTTFDETDLDPATDWKEAWQNQDADGPAKGYVGLKATLAYVESVLSGSK